MKVSIVFQGPTNYCEDALQNLSSKHEIIYSTWIDEPEENLKFIKSRVSKLVLNEHPKYTGFRNINRQTISSKKGILEATGDFILKSRSDILFSNIDLFIEKAQGSHLENLSFFCYYKNICNPYQITDFFTYGSKEESLMFWDYIEQPNQVFPKYEDPRCPERQLLFNYIKLKNNNDPNEFLKNSNCFAKYLDNESDVKWLKFNYSLVSAWKEDLQNDKTD
jgi:hypothetical protein